MMNKYKKSLLLLLSSAAGMGFGSTAYGAIWSLDPSISVTETYTDNVDLDSAFSQSDFVTRVNPSLALTADGARLKGSLVYAPNYFYYGKAGANGRSAHDFRQFLSANVNSELVRNHLFLDVGALVNQEFLDRRGALSRIQETVTNNRATVQRYFISPSFRTSLGPWATTELSYDLGYTRRNSEEALVGNLGLSNESWRQTAGLNINSGSRFTKLGWTLSSSYSNEGRQNADDFETLRFNADLSFEISRMISLLGSAGYEDRNVDSDFARFDGFVWDAGVRLVPGPRTSLSVRYGNRFTGDTYSVDGFYRISPKSTISLTYTDKLQTFQSLGFDFGFSNPDLGSVDGVNFFDDALVREKRWNLSVSGIRGRTSYSLYGGITNTTSENVDRDEERWFAGASLNRNLSTRLSIGTQFSYNDSKFVNVTFRDKYWNISANVSYLVSKKLTASLEYVHTDRDRGDGSTFSRASNFVSFTLRTGF